MTLPSRTPPTPWWAAAPPPYPGLADDLETDVTVIGGGITGITLAWTLAEQGGAVALLEAGRLAGEGSGRNAGFLLAIPAEPYAERVALWGREGARALLQVSRRSHRRIAAWVESLGIECGYRVPGSLRLTRSEEETEDLRAALPELRHDGFPMRELSPADVLPAHARGGFHGAFEVPEDGVFDPVAFLHGLAADAVRRGARVHEGTHVTGARWRDGMWEAQADGRRVRSRVLVIASNAWAPRLVPALEPLIVPRRGQMLCTAPIAARLDPRPVYANYGYQYWRQLDDGRLLIGGWRNTALEAETGYETEPTPAIQARIEEGLRELVPGGAAVECRWAGTMAFARDGRPLVGWLDAAHHLAICAGHTGHGLGLAPACTEDLARVLAFNRAPGIGTFDPHRFAEVRSARDGIVALGAASA